MNANIRKRRWSHPDALQTQAVSHVRSATSVLPLLFYNFCSTNFILPRLFHHFCSTSHTIPTTIRSTTKAKGIATPYILYYTIHHALCSTRSKSHHKGRPPATSCYCSRSSQVLLPRSQFYEQLSQQLNQQSATPRVTATVSCTTSISPLQYHHFDITTSNHAARHTKKRTQAAGYLYP